MLKPNFTGVIQNAMQKVRPALQSYAMQKKIAGEQGGQYAHNNAVTAPSAREWEAMHRQNYQGYTFTVPNGGSQQILSFPGDIRIINGICASYDDTTNPGFNCTIQMTVNNENCYNTVDLQLLNIRRFIVDPGYLPLNKVVAAQSTFTLNLNNGTGATIQNVNFILVYC